jgi:glycosyltransferase involved in cell wall biosynthesis
MSFNLQVVGMPHTAESKDYGQCAFTQKVRKFLRMFPNSYHYGNEGSDAPSKEFIQIFSKKDQERLFGSNKWFKQGEIYSIDYNPNLPYWVEFNAKVISEMARRIKPNDIICLITGSSKMVAEAFPNNITVEFGVGYEGVFSKYKVFESYAWMHTIYGWKMGAANANGSFYDDVIWNYFEKEDFPESDGKGDYLLWIHRPVARKGLEIAKQIAKRTGIKLIVAGAEKVDGENVEWVGYADYKKRGELLAHARALIMPTLYIEMFGGAHMESMMCGTPIITTDWGVFTETNIQGKTGFRCRTMKEFCEAVEKVKLLDRKFIRNYAQSNCSLEVTKPKYQRYFDRIQSLNGNDWYKV